MTMFDVPADAAGVHDGPRLGDLGARFLARLIDGVVGLLLGSLLFFGPMFIAFKVDWVSQLLSQAAAYAILVLAVLTPPAYEAVMTAVWGAPLGKMAMKLRVVRAVDAGPVGGGTAVLRAATSWVLALMPCVGLLDPLWCTWDRPNRQTLHDKAARTLVIRVDAPSYVEAGRAG